MRRLPLLILACALTCAASLLSGTTIAADDAAPVRAKEQPDGTVVLNGGSVAAGIGYLWGHGDLSYNDQTYHFSISGISVADAGASSITAEGSVYHLKDIADFAGNYTAVSAGLTIAGGGSASYLQNEHGVVIKLASTSVGLGVHLSANGVRVKLAQ